MYLQYVEEYCIATIFCTCKYMQVHKYVHTAYVYMLVLQIHWFSIFNSFMMVIFLVGLVSMILMRTLRKDYARYSREEELDDLVSQSTRSCTCLHVTVVECKLLQGRVGI